MILLMTHIKVANVGYVGYDYWQLGQFVSRRTPHVYEPRQLLVLHPHPSALPPLYFRMSTDPLAEISGIKPKRYLKDGEQVEVQSKSSSVLC